MGLVQRVSIFLKTFFFSFFFGGVGGRPKDIILANVKEKKTKNNQPSKNDLETISKQMLDTIINSIRSKMQLTQWRNTTSVITWFSNIEEKNKPSLFVFYNVKLESLISEQLLRRPLKYIVHSHSKKETLLFDKNESNFGLTEEIHLCLML